MPTRVKFRVKRGSLLPVDERAKKQRTANIPCTRVKSETINTAEEVIIAAETEEVDGSIVCDHIARNNDFCEPSSDPHISHSAITSSITSKQYKSQEGSSDDDNTNICAFERNYRLISRQHWDQRFQELVDFKHINGHVMVPTESGPLGIWVDAQRKAFCQYKDSPLTNERREKLESIGFIFDTSCQLWDQRFQELVDFKAIKGHTNVCRYSGLLGKWVDTQRQYYRALKEGKPLPLTNIRREKLESIGFIFDTSSQLWDQRFQELVDFKVIEGHTNVCRHSGSLGIWVDTQRQYYRALKEGKPLPFTNGRREKLESIGFVFQCRPNIQPWDQRFQELVDFKMINGHTNVQKQSGQLGNWVYHQRQAFRLLKEGKYSSLTTERCEKLESIGFTFVCRPECRPNRNTPWDQRFEEVVDFKKINGHIRIVQSSGPLGRWVERQRRQYRLLKEGKPSYLTNERCEKLESIGVVSERR